MKPYKNPINIPDEHMRMVGIIAAQWEWIELTLERTITEIMGLDINRVGVLTTNLGFQTKCDIILLHVRPAKESDNPTWRRFTKVYEGLKEAQKLRSKFVHAIWEPGENDIPIRNAVTTTGKKLTVDEQPTPIEELYEVAETIWKNGEEFASLMQEFDLLQT